MKTLAEVERDALLRALAHFRGNKTRTAAALGISIRTIDNKLEAYGLSTETRLHLESDLKNDRPKRAVSLQERQEVQEVSPAEDLKSAAAAWYARGG